jgi:hypothetical protein
MLETVISLQPRKGGGGGGGKSSDEVVDEERGVLRPLVARMPCPRHGSRTCDM